MCKRKQQKIFLPSSGKHSLGRHKYNSPSSQTVNKLGDLHLIQSNAFFIAVYKHRLSHKVQNLCPHRTQKHWKWDNGYWATQTYTWAQPCFPVNLAQFGEQDTLSVCFRFGGIRTRNSQESWSGFQRFLARQAGEIAVQTSLYIRGSWATHRAQSLQNCTYNSQETISVCQPALYSLTVSLGPLYLMLWRYKA